MNHVRMPAATRARPRTAVVLGTALALLTPCAIALDSSVASAAAGKSVSLKSGTVTLAFTAKAFGLLTKSTTGGVSTTRTATPVAPATSPKRGHFSLPISHGKINPKTGSGKISAKGGIQLTSMTNLIIGTSTNQGELVNFNVKLGSAPQLILDFVGSSTTPKVPFATLNTKHSKHSKHGHVVTLSGIKVDLTATGVQLLNNFAPGFKTGQQIATLSASGTT